MQRVSLASYVTDYPKFLTGPQHYKWEGAGTRSIYKCSYTQKKRLSKVQFSDENFYLIKVTKNNVMVTRKWQWRRKMIVIYTDTVVACIL